MLPLGCELTVVTSWLPIAPAWPARPGSPVLADGLIPEPGSGGPRAARA